MTAYEKLTLQTLIQKWREGADDPAKGGFMFRCAMERCAAELEEALETLMNQNP